MDLQTYGRAQSNMSLQLFQSWGHNKTEYRSKRNPTGTPQWICKQPKHQTPTITSIDKSLSTNRRRV